MYRPPTLPTYAERKREKERQLAIAEGREGPGEQGAAGRGRHVATNLSSSGRLMDAGHGDQDSGDTSHRRPLPLPTNPHSVVRDHTASNNPTMPHASPAPRALHHFASHMNLGTHPASRNHTRDLPLPTAGELRNMPSLPQIQQQTANPVEPRPLPRPGQPLAPASSLEQRTLARQTSTPILNGRTARPLPTPVAVRSRLQPVPEPSSPSILPLPSVSSLPIANPSGPGWPSPMPVIDRSDTVSSIKSLDRWELSQQTRPSHSPSLPSTISGVVRGRPLPPPPMAKARSDLVPSRSLDRVPLGSRLMGMSEASAKRGDEENAIEAVRASALPSSTERRATVPVLNLPVVPLHDQMTVETGSDTSPCVRNSSIDRRGDSGQIPIPAIAFPDSADERDSSIVIPQTKSPLPAPPSRLPSVSSITINPSRSADDCQVEVPTISVTEDVPKDGSANNPIPAICILEAGDSKGRAPTPPSSPPKPSPTGPGIFCSACDLVILGSVINSAGKRWHPDCLRCTTCHVGLEHVSRFEHEGKPYCHMDYHEQFGVTCHHCLTPIVDQRYITIDDATLGKRFYHELHFFCGECGTPFLDPSQSSSAGTEMRKKSADTGEEDQTAAFVIHGRHAFCPECDIKLHRTKCRGCKLPIRDDEEALEALKGKWHRKCFKCASCQQPIPSEYFVPVNRKPYCQDCYAETS